MKINVVRVPRKPQWPILAVFVVSLWLVLGVVIVLLSNHFERPIQLCLFKRFSGVPCPTCGLTRGGVCLLKGHFIKAWFYNPLLFSIMAVLLAVVFLRVLFGRAVQIQLTRKERIAALVLAIVLLSINWVYVIFYVR